MMRDTKRCIHIVKPGRDWILHLGVANALWVLTPSCNNLRWYSTPQSRHHTKNPTMNHLYNIWHTFPDNTFKTVKLFSNVEIGQNQWNSPIHDLRYPTKVLEKSHHIKSIWLPISYHMLEVWCIFYWDGICVWFLQMRNGNQIHLAVVEIKQTDWNYGIWTLNTLFPDILNLQPQPQLSNISIYKNEWNMHQTLIRHW